MSHKNESLFIFWLVIIFLLLCDNKNMSPWHKRCPKQKFGVARKIILCWNKKFDVARKVILFRQKRVDVARKSISCQQKKSWCSTKKYFMSTKIRWCYIKKIFWAPKSHYFFPERPPIYFNQNKVIEILAYQFHNMNLIVRKNWADSILHDERRQIKIPSENF